MRTIAAVSMVLAFAAGTARAAEHWPTTKEALAWRMPAWWEKQAACIHSKESAGLGWHLNHVDWRGKWSPYAGGMQFLDSTWKRAGGLGSAWQWSEREQLYRAWRIFKMHNKPYGSWAEWGTRRMCGV